MKNEFTKKQQTHIDKCQGRLKEIIIEEYRETNKIKQMPAYKAFMKQERQKEKAWV